MKISNDIMTKKVLGITQDDSLLLAFQLMEEHKIRHLPVFDEGRHLIGIISDRDIQRALITDKGNDGHDEKFLSQNKKVRDFMTEPVVTVAFSTPVLEVSALLRNMRISAVMVLDEQAEPCGIITTDDLLQCLEKVLRRDQELESKPLSFFFSRTLF